MASGPNLESQSVWGEYNFTKILDLRNGKDMAMKTIVPILNSQQAQWSKLPYRISAAAINKNNNDINNNNNKLK